MSTRRDYYTVLNISRDASEDEIKKSYRKLAMQYHPDKNPGDRSAEEKFKEASEAYEVLRDPQKRRMYDQYGHDGLRGGFNSNWEVDFDLSDALRTFMSEGIFGDFFGGTRASGSRRPTRVRGSDLQLRLELKLEEIAEGVTKKLKLKKYVRCSTCSATGSKNGKRTTCQNCKGSGEIRQVSRSLFGQFINVTGCPVCRGEGTTITDPCPDCEGNGRRIDETTLVVEVPAGVSAGNYMTLRSKGHAGPHGGPPGDVIVVFDEKEHEIFERHGNDILFELPVSIAQVVLGDRVEIPTLDKTGAILEIDPGTQPGKILRMRRKGIPELKGGGIGDQLIRVRVWIPKKISADERKLFQRLAKSENMIPPNQNGKGFFSKVKDAFS